MPYLRNELVVNGKYRAARMGDLVEALMASSIRPQEEAVDPVRAAWEQVVPPALARHCRVQGLKKSRLHVKVSGPAYLYELRLCGPEMTRALQELAPEAKIRDIHFALR